jgi:hypothetical protein
MRVVVKDASVLGNGTIRKFLMAYPAPCKSLMVPELECIKVGLVSFGM